MSNIERRVLIGIASFVGMMLLVGWVAINEPARMDVFTQQWQGRSIEKGAELFLNNCASCHGVDAKGLPGVAPALNNPMLFVDTNPANEAAAGLKALQDQKKALEDAKAAYAAAIEALPGLEQSLATATEAEKEEIQKQIEAANIAIRNNDPEADAKIAELDEQIGTAQANVDALVAQGWEAGRAPRLEEMGWTSTLADYLESTLVAGRPNSKFYWPQAMPFWAQSSGGPLRDDEIDNLVDYLMNFETMALKMTPAEVNQQFKIPADPANVTASDEPPVGSTVDVMTLDLAGGDAINGQTLYTNLGCQGCHGIPAGAAYAVAPAEGTYTRVVNIRLNAPENAGKTAEQYLAESIIHPNTYIVPGGTQGLMPAAFGDTLTLQDLKDLIAFLATQQ